MTGDSREFTELSNDRKQKNKAIAGVFCAPALIKYGTSKGDHYNQEVVICKAVVDCMVVHRGQEVRLREI